MKGLESALTLLSKLTKPVSTKEEIMNVATISANGDTEIGELISKALDRVSKLAHEFNQCFSLRIIKQSVIHKTCIILGYPKSKI